MYLLYTENGGVAMFTVTEKWKPEDPLVLGVFTDEGQTSLIKQLKESAGLHTPEYLEGGLADFLKVVWKV